MIQVNDIMLDLETMDTRPTAAIVQIGAVAFNQTSGVVGTFSKAVSLESSMKNGLTTSGNIVMWWLSQGKEAQNALLDRPVDLDRALVGFTNFAQEATRYNSNLRIWGNGASFDLPIIENAMRAIGMVPPWKFWNHRCYRTMAAMVDRSFFPREEGNVAHDALHDARYQAERLIAIYNKLGLTLS